MEQVLKKVTQPTAETAGRTVVLSLDTHTIHLHGQWNWEMQSDALYCSDVMYFPESFNGTKSIVHPEDLSGLRAALGLMEEKAIPFFQFRIITTYGEIKIISGQEISIQNEDVHSEFLPGKEEWEAALKQLTLQRKNDFLQLRHEVSELTERLHNLGSWLLNKHTGEVWYSDNVFRLYGLAPQSLNAHANTFNAFIHHDDRMAVQDAFDKAYSDEIPVHIEYRIVLPGGKLDYIQQITTWFYNYQGHAIFCGIIRKITEERIVSDELIAAQSQTLLHLQLLKFSEHQTSTGLYSVHLLTRKAVYSDNCYRMYGLRPTSLADNNAFYNLIHPDDYMSIREGFDKMYEEQVLPEAEFRIIRPDGKIRYLKQIGKFFISSSREPMMMVLIQDITLFKSLEKRLSELNETLTLRKIVNELSESGTQAGSVTWQDANNMQWTDGFYQLLGYKPGGIRAAAAELYKLVHPDDIKEFKKAEDNLLQYRRPDDIEIRMISRTGVRTVRVGFRHVNDERDFFVAIVQDVTKQKELRQKQEENELLGRLVADSVSDILFFTNGSHTIMSWSYEAEKKTGITKENALYHHLFDVFPGLKQNDYITQLNSAINGNEVQAVRAHEAYLATPHDYRLAPLKTESGEVLGVLHIVHDISEQLLMQQQLSERLNFIESLLEASVDQIVVLDRFMNYLYWNKRAEEYYAIAKETVIGKNILEIFPSFRNHPSYTEFRKVLRGEMVHLPADISEETEQYSETYLIPIKDGNAEVTAILWIVHDLSREFELQKEKRQAEEKIREQAHYLRRITETTPDMISIMELETRKFTFLNEQTFIAHGFDPVEIHQRNGTEGFQMIHPDDYQSLANYFQSFVQASDEDVISAEYRAKAKDGEWKWFSVRGKVFQREGEKVTHVLNAIENITDRKKAEASTQQTKELLQTILDTSLIGICLHEAVYNDNGELVDFRMRIVNRELEQLTGRSDLKDKLYLVEFPGVRQSGLFDIMVRAVETGEPKTLEYSYHHDGFKKTFTSTFAPSGNYLIATNLDITSHRQAEENLKESRHWLEQTTKASPDSITVYDLQKKQPVYLNNCLADWVGLSNDDLVEMGPERRLKLIHPDDRLNLLHFNEKAAAAGDGEVVTIEYRIETAAGNIIWVRNRSKPFLRDASGNVTHILSILQNVTDEIELREELKLRTRFAETILDASVDRITVFDRKYRFVGWNKRCEQIHKKSKEEVIGRTIFEMFPGVENYPEFMNSQERSLKGEYVHVPKVQDGFTGSYIELFYIPLKNENGETYAVVNIMHDVTEFVNHAEAVNSLNKSLEAKNTQLEQKNEEITSFAFVASHDMKEPLRKIHTFSDWLLEEEAVHLSEKGKSLVEKISFSVHRMEMLIEDILVLTKIHTDAHKNEMVDLNKVLQLVSEDMADVISETQTMIIAGELPAVKGNFNQVFYLFKNLISNAIKFQKPGNIPQVKITSEMVRGEEMLPVNAREAYRKISFTDNGFGFDKRYAKKIFQVFQRLHGKHEFEGTGIGLAICKKIMENHEGTITVESEQGRGSTFSCFFPLH